VIPYGIDLETFAPGDRAEARRALSLPADVAVLVFVANGIRKNPWRDYGALRTALEALQLGETPIVCLALGDEEEVDEELAGLLVPPRDPHSLRAALERVLVDDERRQRLGRRAAEEAQRRFSLTREIDDHLDLFASARDAFDRVARGG
jgi:glycosyltransferase involved in cell wall biosynthesis